MKRWTPGWASYGRGRTQMSATMCATPSASSALKPAATTPRRPLTDRHLPRTKNSTASSATKAY